MRINKFISVCGVCSRRNAEDYVINGKVTVNDIVINSLSYQIKETDVVKINGKTIKPSEEKVYYMLNKPKCYITSTSDELDRKTVLDLIKEKNKKLFPVGRLDYNTEGLLLITNDGDFANSIIHPSKHIKKTYEILTKIKPSQTQLSKLRKGVCVDGEQYLPCEITNPISENEYYKMFVTIFQGKNRQIRNMFNYIQIKIYNLKRIKIGNLELGNLKMGSYIKLTSEDLEKIFK